MTTNERLSPLGYVGYTLLFLASWLVAAAVVTYKLWEWMSH